MTKHDVVVAFGFPCFPTQMRPSPVPTHRSGALCFSRALSNVALLLFGLCSATAQWQRIEIDAKGGLGKSVQCSPHPLQFYLTPSPDQDPSNSLCLGCKVGTGQAISLENFVVHTSSK